MAAAGTGSSTGGLYIIAILLLFIIIRLRRIINGTKVSVARTIGYSAYYVVFGVLVLSGSFFIGISTTYFIAYPILFLAAFYGAYEIARRRLVFWKSGEDVYSKGGTVIYLIYIAGLVSRLALDYIYLGPNSLFFSFPTQTQTLSATAITAILLTDILLVAGVGLLFGRNMRILKTFLGFKKGSVTIPESTTQGDTNPSMPP